MALTPAQRARALLMLRRHSATISLVDSTLLQSQGIDDEAIPVLAARIEAVKTLVLAAIADTASTTAEKATLTTFSNQLTTAATDIATIPAAT
jgi:hypothetical protein